MIDTQLQYFGIMFGTFIGILLTLYLFHTVRERLLAYVLCGAIHTISTLYIIQKQHGG